MLRMNLLIDVFLRDIIGIFRYDAHNQYQGTSNRATDNLWSFITKSESVHGKNFCGFIWCQAVQCLTLIRSVLLDSLPIHTYCTLPRSRINTSPSLNELHDFSTSSHLTWCLPLICKSLCVTFCSTWLNPEATPPFIYLYIKIHTSQHCSSKYIKYWRACTHIIASDTGKTNLKSHRAKRNCHHKYTFK